jgi:hypothetical protein
MIFFRFQHLILLRDANVQDRRSTEIHLPWPYFCFPWVLSNEGVSHPDLSTQTSLMWFKMAYFYLMICQDTGQRIGFDKNMKEYGNAGHNGTKKTLFDRKLIRHRINTIAILVYEMEFLPVGETLSVQSLIRVPVETLFGLARLQTKTYQTVTGILDTMAVNQVLRLLHANQVSKKRKFKYGEIVTFVPEFHSEQYDVCDLVSQAEASLYFVGFRVSNYRELRKRHEPSVQFSAFLESCVLPSIPNPETHQQRRSLYQEFLSVMPSGRHSMLSTKMHLRQLVKPEDRHLMKIYTANILGTKKI